MRNFHLHPYHKRRNRAQQRCQRQATVIPRIYRYSDSLAGLFSAGDAW